MSRESDDPETEYRLSSQLCTGAVLDSPSLQQDSAVFNEHTALYLAGPLHEDALKRSFREMIRRHEVLRTVCTVEGGQLRQKILPELPLNFPTLHLQQIPREERKSVAEQCALEDARQAFDLEKGPFLRTRLLTFAADEHVLLLTVHHFIIDGWSMRVMARELSALYNSYVQGREPELPEPEIQYADYALWQRKIHENHGFDEGIRFWNNQLEGATTILDMPSDRPPPAHPGNGGATELFELSPELSQRLERLCCRGRHAVHAAGRSIPDSFIPLYPAERYADRYRCFQPYPSGTGAPDRLIFQ